MAEPPNGVEGICTLVFWGPRKMVSTEIELSLSFHISWPILCCWCLGGQGVRVGAGAGFTVERRMCLYFLIFIFTLFLFLSLSTSFLLEVERKRPRGKRRARGKSEYF